MLNLMLIAAGGPEHSSELKYELKWTIMEEITWINYNFSSIIYFIQHIRPETALSGLISPLSTWISQLWYHVTNVS